MRYLEEIIMKQNPKANQAFTTEVKIYLDNDDIDVYNIDIDFMAIHDLANQALNSIKRTHPEINIGEVSVWNASIKSPRKVFGLSFKVYITGKTYSSTFDFME